MPMSESLSSALSVDKRSMYIPAAVVSLFESAGARIAPIPYDLPKSALKALFHQLNGVVFPGGTASFSESDAAHPKFRASAMYLLELALAANDRGEHFPLLGTCLGFEMLAVLIAEDDDVLCGLNCFAASGVSLSLNLTPGAASSRFFAGFSAELMDAVAHQNVTFNSHSNGMSPQSLRESPKLNDFWNLLSTSRDLAGNEFISTVEAKRYPIWGVQWHPEKPAFEFIGMEGVMIPHTQEAIEIGQQVANNFVFSARRNSNRFTSILAEQGALLDKTSIYLDPRHLFSQIFLVGVERHAMNHEVPIGVSQLPEYSEKDPLGLLGKVWLPMGLELEMVECPSRALPVSRLVGAETAAMRQGSSGSIDPTVSQWLRLTGSAVRNILQTEPVSEALRQAPDRAELLESLYVKVGHDDEGTLQAWNWEAEKTGKGELELSSPVELSEEEVKFAINVSKRLVGRFTGVQYSSFQAHVEARCLLAEDRLVGMLLLWEKYHFALQNLIQLRWRGPDFARNLSAGNPELLASLQRRWSEGPSDLPLEALFREHSSDIRKIRDARDGYRNFAVNVCHVLNIDCCQECPKNFAPKFGAVEFRMFNSEFGSPLRFSIMLFQRIVQRSCTAPLAELKSMTLNKGGEAAADATALFDFLDLNPESMKRAFVQSGAERWLWFCP